MTRFQTSFQRRLNLIVSPAALGLALAAGGCGNPVPPPEVSDDVAAASDSGADKSSKSDPDLVPMAVDLTTPVYPEYPSVDSATEAREEEESLPHLVWERDHAGVTITGFKGNPIDLRIPSTIEGTPVTAIGLGVDIKSRPLVPGPFVTRLTPWRTEIDASSVGFMDCKTLQSVVVPSSVRQIGDVAFAGCERLRSVTLPDGATLGAAVFAGCTRLQSIRLPKDLTTIDRGTFYECEDLLEIVLPENLMKIDFEAFSGCSNLHVVVVPDSVTTIGEGAFENCKALRGIKLPARLAEISDKTFQKCASLREVEIPSNVTSIGRFAFNGCKALKSVKLPSGLETLKFSAFSHCSGLTELTLPESVTEIESYAFEACSGLKELKIPSTVRTVYMNAFTNCPAGENVVVPEGAAKESPISTDTRSSEEILADIKAQSLERRVKDAKSTEVDGVTLYYKAANRAIAIVGYKGEGRKLTIPDEIDGKPVKAIDGHAFEDAPFEEIVLPQNLEKIEFGAFFGAKIKTITIPGNVQTSHLTLFDRCKDLESIVVEEGVTEIPSSFASHLHSLEKVTLPSTIKKIGSSAFSGDDNLEFPELPEGLEELGIGVFSGCHYDRIVLPGSIKTIVGSPADYDTTVVVPTGSVTEKTARKARLRNLVAE